MSLPFDRTAGMDAVPYYRAQSTRTASCQWQYHYWVRFINIALGDVAVIVLCRNCGRTPLEAMDDLPMAPTSAPKTPKASV